MNQVTHSALVTGAAGGIGAAVAKAFSQRGVRVLLVDRNESVVQMAQTLPGASARVVDLSIEKEVLDLARYARGEFGGCDILVNNAGINPKREGRGYRTEEIDMEVWNAVMQVNLAAPFLLCRELLPAMRERGWGRVINIASRAGRTYIPGVSTFYSVSKAGLVGMTRQLAGEFAASGITVNCVAPGPVDTPLSLQSSKETLAKSGANVPSARRGTAEEIAAAVDFLATPGAGFVCGACIDANGGGFMG